MDGWTDGWTDGSILICLPKFLQGHKKNFFLVAEEGGWGVAGVSEFFYKESNTKKKFFWGGGEWGGGGVDGQTDKQAQTNLFRSLGHYNE